MPSDAPIRVVIDTRESDPRIRQLLENNPGVSVEVRRLFVGDFLVENRLVIERKALRDLGSSIASGRIFAQARLLVSSDRPCLILLEGAVSEFRRLGLPRKAIQGALVSLTVAFGIPVLRARDPIESAQLILYAGRHMTRLPRPVSRRRFPRPKLKQNIQLEILQALPKLGLDRAKRVLSKFETIGALAYASTYDIEQVEGIGPKIAQAIYWALH